MASIGLLVRVGMVVFEAVKDAQLTAEEQPGGFKKALVMELIEETLEALGVIEEGEKDEIRRFADRFVERVVGLFKRFKLFGKGD